MSTQEASEAHVSQDQLVSQDEVERLLAQMAGGGDSADEEAKPNKAADTLVADCEHHVFPPLSFFSPSELRKLRVHHEEFIRCLAARLAVYLRLEVGLQMSKLETMSYQKFAEGISNPTHLTFLRLEPLRGTCVLEIPARLALTLVDRELGGAGVFLEEARELSNMEGRLLRHVLEIIVGEWCNSWADLIELRPLLSGQESSGRYIQTSPPDHMMLLLGIEVRVGELVEQFQWAFPYQTLEAILLKLSLSPAAAPASVAAEPVAAAAWNPRVGDLRIAVSARLPKLKLTARQLTALRPGDILPLADGVLDEVHVCFQNKPRFIGSFGTAGDRSAVQLSVRTSPALAER